jgi:hypothetical protein
MSDQSQQQRIDERDENPRGLLECEERPLLDPEQDDGDTIIRSVN